jgi:hypothetical protein
MFFCTLHYITTQYQCNFLFFGNLQMDDTDEILEGGTE